MEYKLTEKVYREDLKIPKDYRLIEDEELKQLSREDMKIKKLLIDGYLWCNTKKGVMAGWLFDFGDGSRFNAGDRGVGLHCSLRGVLVEKTKEKQMEQTKVKNVLIKVKKIDTGEEGWITLSEFSSMFMESIGSAIDLTFKQISKEMKSSEKVNK